MITGSMYGPIKSTACVWFNLFLIVSSLLKASYFETRIVVISSCISSFILFILQLNDLHHQLVAVGILRPTGFITHILWKALLILEFHWVVIKVLRIVWAPSSCIFLLLYHSLNKILEWLSYCLGLLDTNMINTKVSIMFYIGKFVVFRLFLLIDVHQKFHWFNLMS